MMRDALKTIGGIALGAMWLGIFVFAAAALPG